MRELVDYTKRVREISDKTAELMKSVELSDVEFSRSVEEILSRKLPSICFYGLYNAGKSSIINAIFGKEIARVGDIPTTREVQTITHDNFLIVDTLGINAQNEHTLVAESEIIKHDVVLFVLDDSSIEEKSFYTAFVSVLKSGKPVMIAINDKNPEDESLEVSERIKKLKNRINANIDFAAKNAGINNFLNSKNYHGLTAVNACTAFDAKQDNSEQLYDESNLD
ncbi:MAG: 50S ribosome-binding GTPase, partial [Oscillospiraceae bacterium]|nr:50S ribosome-binding GTPase [Oscillospiraceae bacterium]